MIKIKNKNLDLICEWYYEGFTKSIGFKKIEELVKGKPTNQKKFWQFVQNNIKDIITGTPERLEEILGELQEKIKNDFLEIVEDKEIKSVFNYSAFSSKKKKGWSAYNLAKKLNVPTCPYCNIQYTHTVIKGGGDRITRPDFDHFLNQSSYPFFALSFYNLVPSCNTCNSKSKGKNEFFTTTHIHPYLYGFENLIKFQLKINDTSFFHGNLKGGEIELVPLVTSDSKELQLLGKAKRNIKDLNLDMLYQKHLDYAYDQISKAMVYSIDHIQSLQKQFDFLPYEDVLRIFNTNYIDSDELHLRPLSKLTKDLHEQFELDFVESPLSTDKTEAGYKTNRLGN